MARQYICIDDLDGETPGAETVSLAVDGYPFEIDLGPDNLKKIRDLLLPYIKAGRAVTTGKQRAPRPAWSEDGDDPAARAAETPGSGLVHTQLAPSAEVIRMWWTANWKERGLNPPKAMGIIPGEVREAYMAAQRTADAVLKVAADDGTREANGTVTVPEFKDAG